MWSITEVYDSRELMLDLHRKAKKCHQITSCGCDALTGYFMTRVKKFASTVIL